MEWEGRRKGRAGGGGGQDEWVCMKSERREGVLGHGSGRAEAEGAQPSCVMSDTRLNLEKI